MDWAMDFLNASRLFDVLEYAQKRPEMVLAPAALIFLLLKGNFRTTLILSFGAALCWTNYYIFAHTPCVTVPLVFGVSFAAILAIVLVLLACQLINTA